MSQVQYRDIPGFPGYRVGDDGSVWSFWEAVGRGFRNGFSLVLGNKPSKICFSRRKGYMLVKLVRNGDTFSRSVHRLVLEAFVGPCGPGQECRHLNGNKSDNRLCNLKWGSRKENMSDRLEHGGYSRMASGENNGNSRLRAEEVVQIKSLLAQGVMQKTIANRFGVHHCTVGDIARGRRWKNL